MSHDFGAIAAVETAGTAAALPALSGAPPARNHDAAAVPSSVTPGLAEP